MIASRALGVKVEKTRAGACLQGRSWGQSLMTWMWVREGWSQGVPKDLEKGPTVPRIPCVAVYNRIGRVCFVLLV